MLKIYVASVCAKIGSYCCRKAIKLAGYGHIDFEVKDPRNPTIDLYQSHIKLPYKYIKMLMCMVTFLMVSTLLIWGIFHISDAINNAHNGIVDELKKEHKESLFSLRNY